tara:strand:+ start:631 stop:1254 length:624 start_codon:yes stop_codon:yes gene_type:complete
MRSTLFGLLLLLPACVSTPYYLPNSDTKYGKPIEKWQRSTDYDLRTMGESPLFGRKLKADEAAHIRALVRPSFRPDHAIHLVSYKDGTSVARLKQLGYKPTSTSFIGRWVDTGLIHTDNVSVSQSDVETIQTAISNITDWRWDYPVPENAQRSMFVCADGESYILEILNESGYRYIEENGCGFERMPDFALAIRTLKGLMPTSEPPW